MINTTNEFKKLMSSRTDFKEKADITLSDGTVLNLSANNFTVSNNTITDGADYNGLPLGTAISKHIQLEIMNNTEQYSQYDFFGAKIRLYLIFQLSDSVEIIEKGTYTVIIPETYGTTIIINAVDDMHKTEKAYQTSISFPATVREMLVDICQRCDIPLRSTSFDNDSFVVQSLPAEDYTFRQVIGYIAMIAGGNARIDRYGYLEIMQYNTNAFASLDNYLNGGQYVPAGSGDTADGGSFAPWDTGYVYDGGAFVEQNEYHTLKSWKSLKVDTDDVVITGIKAVVDETKYISGTEGYALLIENPLIAGHEQEVVNYLGSIYIGMTFRTFTGDIIANPLIEFMDPAVVMDRKGNMYRTYITDVDFIFFGFTVVRNSAEPPVRNGSKYYSEATKTLVKAKELVEKEKTNRELAVEQLANQLANSSGLFMTTEAQLDKSVIYYMHDKPTLAESMIVWKLTALAFGISTDGGETYPYGFTVDGTTITRLLYAEGINADYINAGAIKIADRNGNTVFEADYDAKKVNIDASSVKIESKTVTDKFFDIETAVNVNADNISLEAKRAIEQEVELAAAIRLNYEQIQLKISSSDAQTMIDLTLGNATIEAKQINLNGYVSAGGGNFAIDENGNLKVVSEDTMVDVGGGGMRVTGTNGFASYNSSNVWFRGNDGVKGRIRSEESGRISLMSYVDNSSYSLSVYGGSLTFDGNELLREGSNIESLNGRLIESGTYPGAHYVPLANSSGNDYLATTGWVIAYVNAKLGGQ